MERIRVLLADDHAIVRQGLKALLGAEPDIHVVGEASSGSEAVELAALRTPCIVVMDINMPEVNGLQAASKIRENDPSTPVIILSMYADEEFLAHAMQAGISGYVLKESFAKELVTAIREVHKGNAYFSPVVAKILVQLHAGHVKDTFLTLREREILQFISQGWTNPQIGKFLCISVHTVQKYRQQLMNKLDLHDPASLTRYAMQRGLVK
jgi:DNA-binding NarL/FixJ family response regulator